MKNNTPLKLVPPQAQPAETKRTRSTLRDTKAKASRTKTKRSSCPLTFEQAADLLKRPVAFHPIHAEIGGSVEAGVFLGQALYWTRIQDETNPDADGWFWKTQEQWHAETAIKRSGQETCRKLLIKKKLIVEELRPLPPPSFQARLHYKVLKENYLAELWKAANSQSAAMQQARLPDGSKLERRQAANKAAAKQQPLSTENTAQTTSQTTSSSRRDDDDLQNLIDALIEQKVTLSRARHLAQNFADEMRRRLEYLPHVQIKTTPARYLSGKPEEEYSQPPQLARQRAAELTEMQAAADARAAAIRRAAQEQRNREMQDRDDALDGHFKNLDDLDRADVDERARQHLTRVMGETRETPAALAIARRAVLRKEFGEQSEENDD